MGESTTSNLKPNEFVIPENQGYACTDIKISRIVEFLMTELEPVNLESIDPDDSTCSICQKKFHISNEMKLSHTPVRTVCGHIFGKPCITTWLDPLFCVDSDSINVSSTGNTSCPVCHRTFFPAAYLRTIEYLAVRLWFWDKAYAIAGVARSQKEEHTRKYLWDYVKYSRSVNEFHLPGNLEYLTLANAQSLLVEFSKTLKTPALTPVQEDLRKTLRRLGLNGLREIKNKLENGLSLFSCIFDSESESGYISEAVDALMTLSLEKNGEDEEDKEGKQERKDEQSSEDEYDSDEDYRVPELYHPQQYGHHHHHDDDEDRETIQWRNIVMLVVGTICVGCVLSARFILGGSRERK